MAQITLDHITKRYPDGYEAVSDMSLDIEDGEFVILVGPSGCGKSTALRMIAGLEDITDGELRIGGDVVNDHAPKDRDIAMVFQNYALYPHMSVRDNMGFALKLRKLDQGEIDKKVSEAAQGARPRAAPGAQACPALGRPAPARGHGPGDRARPGRVPDGRAAVEPRRQAARADAHRGVADPEFARHDHRLRDPRPDRGAHARRPGGVMRAGRIQQVGSPMELYNNPNNLFVAGFIGSPAMNFMPATLEGGTVKLPMGDVQAAAGRARASVGRADGKALIAGIRPENFEDAALVGDASSHGVTFRATIEVLESMGSELYAHFKVESDSSIESQELRELAEDAGGGEVPMAGEEGRIVARLDPASQVKQGEEVELWVDAQPSQLFDPEDGRSLTVASGGAAPRRRRG